MKRSKRPVSGGMTVRAYDVLCRAVEEGAAYGWQRAHKYTDAPGKDVIVDQIVQGVLNAICECFDFDDGAS